MKPSHILPTVLSICLLTLSTAHAQTKPDIDFLAATINGQAMVDFTPEQSAKMFGNPSSTTEPRIISPAGRPNLEIPSSLTYPELGLIFHFTHPRSDPKQGTSYIEVFLSQQTDEASHATMKPFSGTLSDGVGRDWKVDQTVNKYAEFKPVDRYNAKSVEALRPNLVRTEGNLSQSAKSAISMMTQIELKTPKTFVYFQYEDQTKQLEKLRINRRIK